MIEPRAGRFHPLMIWSSAIAFVAIVFFFTNRIPPAWDTLYYLDISRNGLAGNESLASPFAYRFGVPLLFGWVADILGYEIETVYRAGAFLASVCFFGLVGLIARQFVGSVSAQLFLVVLVCSGFWHIKFAAFFDTMIDIYAVGIVCLGWYLILQGRLALAGLLAVLGLLVKEWPGVLLAVVIAACVLKALEKQNWRYVVLALALIVAGVGAILLPRLLIDVAETFQLVDPLNDADWVSKIIAPLRNVPRLFNLGLATLSYWLPLLLLLTPGRVVYLIAELRSRGLLGLCAIHLFLVTVLAFYGGTNLNIFVSYSAPILAIGLGILLASGRIGRFECAALLVVVILFNRLLMDIPDPRLDLDAYLDHLPPFSTRIVPASFYRIAEVLAAIAGFRLVFGVPWVARLRQGMHR